MTIGGKLQSKKTELSFVGHIAGATPTVKLKR
jgi:hypothetical protein